MRHEVVLDTETGLPEVRATRSPEGLLAFRYHTIRPGGMSVWEPITDDLPKHDGDEALAMTFADRVREAQVALARRVQAGADAQAQELDGLRERLDAAEGLLTEERERREEAERMLAASERLAQDAQSSAVSPGKATSTPQERAAKARAGAARARAAKAA